MDKPWFQYLFFSPMDPLNPTKIPAPSMARSWSATPSSPPPATPWRLMAFSPTVLSAVERGWLERGRGWNVRWNEICGFGILFFFSICFGDVGKLQHVTHPISFCTGLGYGARVLLSYPGLLMIVEGLESSRHEHIRTNPVIWGHGLSTTLC